MSRRGIVRSALFVLLVCLLVDAAVAGLCAFALRHGSYLGAEVTRAEQGCDWLADPEGDLGGPECLHAVEGVAIGPLSLVRDATYLGGRRPFLEWRADQVALQGAIQGRTSARLTLGRPARREVTIAVRGFDLLEHLPGQVPLAITVLATLAICSLVFLRRPERSAARALFALGQATVLCAVPTAYGSTRGIAGPVWAAVALYQVNMLGLLVGAVGLCFLAATFPRPILGRRTLALALWLPLGLAALAWGLELAGVFGATMWLFAPLILASLVLLAVNMIRPASQVQRLQARWLLWGLVIPVAAIVITRLPLLVLPVDGANASDDILMLSNVTIPVSIAVGVLRYRLLDIEVVIRRTILGATVTLLVIFLYHLGLSLFAGGMAEGAMPGPLFTTVLVTALVLTVVVGPVQARLEAQLDRLFFRNRYHYRHVLGRVPDGLALLGTSAQAAEHVLSSVGEAMELRRIAVALRPEEGRVRAWSRVRSPGGSPEEGAAVRTPAEPGVWACLEAADGPHLADPGATGTPLDHWLLAEGLELALPLRTPEALVGVLAISAPSGGRLFSGEDIEILRTVAASLALALSHALAFETIREMNEELEARIERRTAELEKVRLQLYQWEKMASLGVLAAGVAHELNTPLGVVLSAVEQIQDQVQAGGPHDETTVRLVQLGVEAARRASQIVGDLRSYSRPETSEVQSLDVRECIHSTLRLLGPSLRHQQIEVALELGEIPTIEGFPALFNQTLTNLVMNAAAAIRRQGTIWIRARVVPQKRVRVEVEDSGPGIPAEMRSRIFEPFFTTKPPGEGTGLGLSLCYTFIEQHGGRIWEEGEPGRGARFVVELPFKLAPEQRARVRASYRLAPGPRGP